MNIEGEIEKILDRYFRNRNHYNFSGILEELTALIQQEREKAVREFVRSKHVNGYGDIPSLNEIEYKAELLEAEQFLKESEGQDDNK